MQPKGILISGGSKDVDIDQRFNESNVPVLEIDEQTELKEEDLKQFLADTCGCEFDWTMERFIEEEVREIRSIVGDSNVVLALSGGVDSSVVARLLHQAIGDQLTCI